MIKLCLIMVLLEYIGTMTSQVYQLNENMNMTYTINDQTFVTMELSCITTGWCAIGFGSTMSNADIICLSNQQNRVVVTDMLSKPREVNVAPVVDAQQDVSLITGYMTNVLYGQFVRKLVTDDASDYPITLMRQTPMIWAINYNASNTCASKHDARGNFTVLFGLMSQVSWDCHYMCQGNCLGPLKSDCLTCALPDLTSFSGYCQQSNTTALKASYDIISEDFILSWGYGIANHIELMVEIALCDWVGIAFGTGMFGTDMVMFQVTGVEQSMQMQYIVEVYDMYGVGNMVPDLDTMRGGTNDWVLVGYGYDASTNLIRAKARRLLNTADPNDIVFSMVDMNVSYAFGNSTGLAYHQANRGVLLLPLSQSSTLNNLGTWGNFVYKGHTILNFVFWGIVSDIGILFARQLKSYPKYAKVHGMIFLFQSIITYFFAFSMITFNREKIQDLQEQDTILVAHFIIGVVILILVTFQLFFGFMVKNNLESLNGSELVYKLKRLHQLCGYILYSFTKINVAIGVEMYAPDYRFPFYAYLILLVLIRLTIEILYVFEVSLFSRQRITYHYVDTDKHFIYDRLVDRLASGISRYELLKEFPKLRFVILREAIYDVSDFNHPGGQFIIEAIRGREIGRYFYGGQPVEKLNIIPHKHSSFAINYIETRYIGDHRNDCCPILYHDEKLKVHKSELMIWKFVEQHKLSNTTKVFYFQSNYFKVRQQLRGVRWFGRYFYIKPFGAGYHLSERAYSIVLCLSELNMQLRQQIIDYFKFKILEHNQVDEVQPPKFEQLRFSNTLNFVIKRQPYSNNMSKFLHETYYKRYEITGPYVFIQNILINIIGTWTRTQ